MIALDALLLITARGGSKGLPGKNLAPLGGIPLVGRSARVGRLVLPLFGPGSRVVCSTDDADIADAARLWGAEIPFMRPAHLASDGARSLDVVLHALDALGAAFDAIVLLQPTSPLTEPDDILGAAALFAAHRLPVVSVCPAEHPVEWMYELDDDARLSTVAARKDALTQRQQARPTYRANGAIFVTSPSALREHQSFFGPDTRAYVMPAERSIDIDTRLDLEAARACVATRAVTPVAVGERRIGPGLPCFVVAEAGVNHNGRLETALALVDAAQRAGADAVKFQTFSADRLATKDAPQAEYQARASGRAESQHEMLKRLELGPEAMEAVAAHCRHAGILFLSTPFDETSCDELDALGVPAFKLGSGDLTNLPLLRHAARKGKPLLVSTGMATLDEVARAVDAVRAEGCQRLVLLHCVSSYPADPADTNLRAIGTLREAFGVPAGFSDHTEGDEAALAAVALGASMVEKHLTLDRSQAGPDHRASTEPAAFAEMVGRIRRVEAALGDGHKAPAAAEAGIARVARRSLVAACPIPAGTVLDPGMVRIRRPGTGLAPDRLESLLGRRANQDIAEGAVLASDMFA